MNALPPLIPSPSKCSLPYRWGWTMLILGQSQECPLGQGGLLLRVTNCTTVSIVRIPHTRNSTLRITYAFTREKSPFLANTAHTEQLPRRHWSDTRSSTRGRNPMPVNIVTTAVHSQAPSRTMYWPIILVLVPWDPKDDFVSSGKRIRKDNNSSILSAIILTISSFHYRA